MMGEWRRRFDSPELPFLLVQLPGYGAVPTQPTAAPWADLREAQRQAGLADANTAIAVTLDIGDPANLHPTNKREVGRRLAIAARHLIYGERFPPSGPVVVGATRRGSDVVVSIRDVTGALTIRGGSPERVRAVRRDPGFLPLGRRSRRGLVDRAVERGRRHARALRVGRLAGVSARRRIGLPAGPFEVAIRVNTTAR